MIRGGFGELRLIWSERTSELNGNSFDNTNINASIICYVTQRVDKQSITTFSYNLKKKNQSFKFIHSSSYHFLKTIILRKYFFKKTYFQR